MESNEVLDKLPRHLLSLVIDQPYNTYTAQDHAVWRYVMRQNVRYLSQVAHGSYVDGLKKTGISIDRIPHMYGMNRILKEIGWAAVAVDGFIPPSAFMEFQAYNVLVIAADIRPIDQLAYTPAPDIIHEAAGHAPIIADSTYAQYLREFGRIGSKAFSSARDYELYEAIRHLSILKADPYSKPEAIQAALDRLSFLEQNMGEPSEMARIRNLHWWTVEYGLIGDLSAPKIYGAGLLSSIGESMRALQPEVRKLPYSLQAAEVGFDITTMQPQLFVTPDFNHLTEVLDSFANTMALRRGGLYGVNQAVESGNTATLVFSSGLELSGTIDTAIPYEGNPCFIQSGGPVMMSLKAQVIPGEALENYPRGISSPLGRPHGAEKGLEDMDSSELLSFGIDIGLHTTLTWPSGILLEGFIERLVFNQGKLVLIHWNDASLSFAGRILGSQHQGRLTQIVADAVIAAYSGPANPDSFGLTYQAPKEKTHKINHAAEDVKLHALYQQIADLRENKAETSPSEIWEGLRNRYLNDWLAALELLEIIHGQEKYSVLASEIQGFLQAHKESNDELSSLIHNGLTLITEQSKA